MTQGADPQTVREAIARTIANTGASDPALIAIGSKVASSIGIDPDMPLETLKRRLLWGERVEQGPDIGAHDYQAWLTREEA